MKWGWNNKTTLQPLLETSELQTLYQQAHAAALPHPQRLVEQHQMGDVASRYRGSGLDYEESREYQLGDEPRFINWQLTARTNKTQLKLFREEHRPAVFILLDHRDSMRFGTQVQLKATQASRIANLVAFAASQQGWAVSAVKLGADDAQWFPETTDSHSIWQFAEAFSGACPPINVDINIEEHAGLHTILPLISNQLVRGTHIYLISDFMDLETNCDTPLLQLQNKHPLFTIQITDPVELELPNAGHVLLQNNSDEASKNIDLSSNKIRADFKQQAKVHHHAIKQKLQGLGCEFYQLSTTEKSPELHIPLPHGLGT